MKETAGNDRCCLHPVTNDDCKINNDRFGHVLLIEAGLVTVILNGSP